MIDFVAYFSTAQDELGYIIAFDGYGTASADLLGGPPMLAHGIYRVQGGTLVKVDAATESASADTR
jgi:hypothetical protein